MVLTIYSPVNLVNKAGMAMRLLDDIIHDRLDKSKLEKPIWLAKNSDLRTGRLIRWY
jgi:hypothetical protein